MKYRYIGFALMSCLLLSCEMKKDLFGQLKDDSETESTENYGVLDLELTSEKEADIPESKGGTGVTGSETVVLDINEFSVEVLDESGNQVAYYASYADLKAEDGLLLPAGNYTIRATLGDDVNAGFDTPFYSGENTCEITAKEVAKIITSCVLSNKKVTFRCSDEFLEKFEDDYSIVIDNNLGALTTTQEETRANYLKDTGILQFTVYASMREGGKSLVYNYDLSKNEQVLTYNNILVDLDIVTPTIPDDPEDPVDPDEPVDPGDPEEPVDTTTVTPPTIKVDVTLIEKEYIIEIPSDFVDSSGSGSGGSSGGGTTEDTSTPTITGTIDGTSFDVNTAQTITSSTSSVIINMYVPTGLETLTVAITIGTLVNNMTLDLLDSSAVATINSLLSASGKSLSVPSKGDKGNLKFDISPFLSLLESSNTFKVTVGDANGKSATATITLNKQ